jgi:Domain of unknown function (DUF6894)
MFVYRFSVRSADGNNREDTGRMSLRDDSAARAFGKAMIRDMVRGSADRYTGWTMDVTKGVRAVCSIAFPSEPPSPQHSAAIGQKPPPPPPS